MGSSVSQMLESVEIGDRIEAGRLSIFPLWTKSPGAVDDTAVLEEGITAGTVTVSEISESGSVPEVLVENRMDKMLFLLEGEEIVGAKQNRVFNLSLLIPANTNFKVPVSCVEAGRWHHRTRVFAAGARASTRVRHSLGRSVTASMRREEGEYASDQHQVWHEVAAEMSHIGAKSETAALSDAYAHAPDLFRDVEEKVTLPEQCTGVAVAVGGKLVGLELLGNRTLWKRHERRILRSFAFDAKGEAEPKRRPNRARVARLLEELGALELQVAPSPGIGMQHRGEGKEIAVGALELNGQVYHVSAVA